jgi:primosomal protein N' (replication factor Y)
MNMIVEVLPDVSGIDRTFAYDVPEELAGTVKVGCIVRVVLHGRRVRGWVVAEVTVPPPEIDLRPVSELVSLGPPPAIVDLGRWAAWRYSGRLRPLLVAASPPRLVRALPPALSRRARPRGTTEWLGGDATWNGTLEREIAAATVQALSSSSSVLRLPPAAPRLAAVEAAVEATDGRDGDVLVLAASRADAVTLADRLERAGHAVALQPEAWAEAASGGRIVVGARSAVLSPVARLRAVIVLDAHADSYQEERVPTWEAAVLAGERARRAGVPCLLVSACPTLDLLAGRRLVTLSRDAERSGWAPIELIDARDEDPHAGGYPTRLATLIRAAVGTEPDRPVLAVLNRKGRARLLACGRCRSLLRCDDCGTALVQLERPAQGELPLLHCPRCASSVPAVCASCGPTRPRIVRPGVARVRDDLAALTGLEVAEIGRTGAGPGGGFPDAPVLVGTEAVLHRATSASLVVFLDFDHELLAPRYRAGEQALALLALASRVVGGRRRQGRVVVRTRLPDHEVLAAALHADPGRLVTAEEPRRALLRLPPTTALALVSGDGADEFVTRLECADRTVEVGGSAAGHFLIRAPGSDALADALASAGQPTPGTRIEVGPRQV